ncbi:unnamed protein product [Phytophthora fragariaefolia]|uniref:Unnamed protein product n=1 Tax=Phytophthora fragariaefolia TaxID=1490495 RepID=A0A9W6X657_9STRA|nr:unnamed protein product [Phytophthora fragariaefolia]
MPGGARHPVWEWFKEIEPRVNSKSHPKARCNFCGERVRSQPKAYMIPHLRKCSAAPPSATQQWQDDRSLSIVTPLTASSSVSEASLDMVSDSSESAEGLELVPHAHGATQLQQLELLRLKAKVAECQARAAEAQFVAERFAARMTLQSLGIPESEIDASLPSL